MDELKAKPRRIFTPEQKDEILRDIDQAATIREGLIKHNITSSLYYKWKRQLKVGINACLRNTKPIKSPDIRRLEEEDRKLKEVILNQSLIITSLKKEMSLD